MIVLPTRAGEVLTRQQTPSLGRLSRYRLQTRPSRHPTHLPPAPTPPQETRREEGRRTCNGHIAHALLVHGGHQDHRLRWHHHGSRQRLKDMKDDPGVTAAHTHTQPRRKRLGGDGTRPGAPQVEAGTRPVPVVRLGTPLHTDSPQNPLRADDDSGGRRLSSDLWNHD